MRGYQKRQQQGKKPRMGYQGNADQGLSKRWYQEKKETIIKLNAKTTAKDHKKQEKSFVRKGK